MNGTRPLTIEGLASYLCLTPRGVMHYVRNSKIPAPRISEPRQHWWDADEIDALMKSGYRSSTSSPTEPFEPELQDEFCLDQDEIIGRSQTWEARFTGIYFLIKGGKIIYVGQSGNVVARVTQHHRVHKFDRWNWIPCRPDELLSLERAYINKLRPPLNRDMSLERLRRESVGNG